MSFFNIFTGAITFLIVKIFASEGFHLKYIADALHLVFLIFPHYCLCSGIRDSYEISSSLEICDDLVKQCTDLHDMNEQCWDLACDYTSRCCSK